MGIFQRKFDNFDLNVMELSVFYMNFSWYLSNAHFENRQYTQLQYDCKKFYPSEA